MNDEIWDEPINFRTANDDALDDLNDEYTAETDNSVEISVSVSNTTSPIVPILLALSESSNWADARSEWKVTDVELRDRDDAAYCECGHRIKKCYYVENIINNTESILGCCCVNAILLEDTNKIFDALKDRRINDAVIRFAEDRGIINDWEVRFLKDVKRKRKLSSKQSKTLDQLRDRIFSRLDCC